MQGKLFQRCTHLVYCSELSLGGNFNTRRMSQLDTGSVFYMKNQRNILVIGNYYVNYQNYQNLMLLTSSATKQTLLHLFLFTNSAQKELVSHMYAEYTQLQLTFLFPIIFKHHSVILPYDADFFERKFLKMDKINFPLKTRFPAYGFNLQL